MRKRPASRSASATSANGARYRLAGPAGEPIDFARMLRSHGCADLPPAVIADDNTTYTTSLRLGDRVRRVTFAQHDGYVAARTESAAKEQDAERLEKLARRIFRLDEDFTPFYAAIDGDEVLGWARCGAGRMLASPTVFEEVVKTICTTNCAWSGTVRMVRALVTHVGDGAFPTAEQMAHAPASFYRDVARAGYRGAYLRALARDVASGATNLEMLLPRYGLNDDEVEERLLALPGVGPYAAAHVMMLLGRYRRLIFDSWTRPKYLSLCGKKRASDRTIERAFKRYGDFAGLAFWLYLTRDWVAD